MPLNHSNYLNLFKLLKPLDQSVLMLSGLTATATAASPTDAAIHKNVLGSVMATLRISNKEINNITKIIKWLKESGLLIKPVSQTIKNEAKGQNVGFLRMLLGTLGPSLFEKLLTGQWAIATSQGRVTNMSEQGTIKPREGNVKAGQDFQFCLFL